MSEVALARIDADAAEKRRSWVSAGVGAALFTMALLVLHHEVAALRYEELTSASSRSRATGWRWRSC